MKDFFASSVSQICLPILLCCALLCVLEEVNAAPRGVLSPARPEDMLGELSYQEYLRMLADNDDDDHDDGYLENGMEKRMPFLSRLGKRFYNFHSRLVLGPVHVLLCDF
ncbi:unnamed protein product [Rodentolepis nana]|uniref:Noggin n=1 Tax=Rodentolepis nana TaxID=102285 RepID=A0A0R3TBS9_RODNA|nr:unnamed protein product [Rodentolepis nana]